MSSIVFCFIILPFSTVWSYRHNFCYYLIFISTYQFKNQAEIYSKSVCSFLEPRDIHLEIKKILKSSPLCFFLTCLSLPCPFVFMINIYVDCNTKNIILKCNSAAHYSSIDGLHILKPRKNNTYCIKIFLIA